MARTPIAGEVVFKGKREVSVVETAHYRFTVRIFASSFSITRSNLSHQTASTMVLLAALGCSRKRILAPVSGRIKVEIGGVSGKVNGIEWLALRMAAGDRPMILKAPALFRHKVMVIDPAPTPNRFTITLVDPESDQRSSVEASREAVDAAIATFS